MATDTIFYVLRTVWCVYITWSSYISVNRLNAMYSNSMYKLYAYDLDVMFDLKLTMFFMGIEFIIYLFKREFATKGIIFHHVLTILGCMVPFMVNPAHTYYVALMSCAEIVSTIAILSHFAKKHNLEFLRKIYLMLYIGLTVLCRFYIWSRCIHDIMKFDGKFICYAAIASFVILDIMWINQCYKGLTK